MDSDALAEESQVASQPPSPLQSLRQPIQLPTEILVDIFLLSLPPTDVAQAPQKTTLALVCGFWNAIIESNPILWSTITIADEIQYVRKSLLKSGDCPVVVNGERPIPDGHVYECDQICCSFLREVKGHAHRWQHVALQVFCKETFTPSATFLAPLESVSLYSNRGAALPNQYFTLLDHANTPHLRDVVLHATPLGHWDISFPPSLLKLDIRKTSPTSAELLSILAACPKLNFLRLHKAYPPLTNDDVDNSAGAPIIVELAALQKLTLDGVPTRLVRDLLGQLKIPEECSISLKCHTWDPSPSTSFLTPVLLRYNGGFQRPKEINQITIAYAPRGFHLDVDYRRWSINIGVYQAGAIRDALGWFGIGTTSNVDLLNPHTLAHFATPNNIPVSLKFARNTGMPIRSVAFNPIFDLPCITRIRTTRLSVDRQDILLSYLSYPNYGTTAVKDSWLFPELCELVVIGVGEDVLNSVMDMVNRRSGSRATAGAPGSPARFKLIEFVHEYYEAIRKGENLVVPDPTEAEWELYLQLVDLLDEDAKVFRSGKRITKTGLEE